MGISLIVEAVTMQQIEDFSRDAVALNSFLKIAGSSPSDRAKLSKVLATFPTGYNEYPEMMESLKKIVANTSGLGLDLDKTFRGLHYVLAGDAWSGPEPYCFLLSGGVVIGLYENETEVRAINSEQLAAFELALRSIDRAEFVRRYDAKALAEAINYPVFDWNDESLRDFMFDKFEELKEVLLEAKNQGKGMLFFVS